LRHREIALITQILWRFDRQVSQKAVTFCDVFVPLFSIAEKGVVACKLNEHPCLLAAQLRCRATQQCHVLEQDLRLCEDRRHRALFKIHKFKIREDGLPSGSVVHENTLVLLRDDIRKAGVRIVKSKKTSSRRDVLRKAVLSALLSAAPLSVLGAATHNGAPTAITLNDGSRLIITKVADKQYTATRAEGDKVVDEKPTGSFNAKNGQVIVLDQGKVKSVRSKTGARADWFLAFSS
jgi:hypothetical protein